MLQKAMLLLVVCVFGGIAHAQEPVLHEFVPDVRDAEATILTSQRADAEPAGIVYEGEVLPAPEGGALESDERPMEAAPGDGQLSEELGRRSPSFRPDRVTDLEGTLGYYEVFNPAIAPFKRVSALDTVALAADGTTPVLGVGRIATRRITIEGAMAPAPDDRPRDRFWGSVVLDFAQGNTVPFPSVSPESRILTLRTEPPVGVHIEKDGADNFYAVLEQPRNAREVRVVFLTDAPVSYFGAAVPEVAVDALASEATTLQPGVQTRAMQLARELGLSRRATLREALDRLIAHFRAFEESHEPPVDTGDIFLDLARGMKGVCRHRAYAFVITALALGIPSRFVQNEAHAWVEVKVPANGWMRVDLGGAAVGLEAHNADDRPHYRPENEDPFPRPSAYQRAYAEAAQTNAAMQAGATGANGANAAPHPGSATVAGNAAQPPSAAMTGEVMADGRMPLMVTVDSERYDVFRGRALDLSGRAASSIGEGVSGLRVEVLLQGEREMLLGVTVTREHGYFHGSFGIPPDLDVGNYRLVVRSPGDEHYGAATAL